MNIPIQIGIIHFVGIGGIGMSGIAEIMHNLGYAVQGSDKSQTNQQIERLKQMGVRIYHLQSQDNISQEISVVVKSSAVKDDNPEIVEAKKQRIPVISRADMLAEIMRLRLGIGVSGSHGKTTTTSMIGEMMDCATIKPTIINGGVLNCYNSNVSLGQGKWIVAEADESDATFIKIPCVIAVITNIDPEHLSFYNGFEGLKKAFAKFIENIPFYGCVIACIDSEYVVELIKQVDDKKIYTYSIEKKADVTASNIKIHETGCLFDITISDNLSRNSKEVQIKDFYLDMWGKHNVLNSLVAVVVAEKLHIEHHILQKSLKNFSGIKRRMNIIYQKDNITIMDDYAHHPTEIKSVGQAIKERKKYSKIIAVVQPHRFSRVKEHYQDFLESFEYFDQTLILPIFAAGEKEIPEINHMRLAREAYKKGKNNIFSISDITSVQKWLEYEEKNEQIMIVGLGAGSISNYMGQLVEYLNNKKNEQ